MDTNLLIAIVGCVVAVATFFIGRQTSAKNTGQEWGELKSDLKHIKDDVKEIKETVSTSVEGLRKEIADERKAHKESLDKVYARIEKLEEKK